MRKHRPDFAIALIVFGMMAAGLIIVYAIGPRVAQALNSQYGTNYSDTYFLFRHAVSVVASIVALVAGYLLKYDFLAKYAKKFLIASIVLCVLVTILGRLGIDALVTCDKGACRSLRIPFIGMGFMPSELFKIAILFYVSWLIKDRKKNKELETQRFFVPLLALFAVIAVLLGWWESDFGSTVVLITMIFAMMWIGGVKLRYLFGLAGFMFAVAAILIFTTKYRLDRIAGEDTYHIDNSLISMGTGGLFGVGLGNSIQSTGYLPEALSDSIFAIICETWGFVGAAAILVAITVLLMRILGVSRRIENPEQRLFAVGVFTWILSHVIINVGGMTGIIPMKGITLPFLSYGGTSMMFVAFAAGIVLQISGWTRREVVEENEDIDGRRGKRRARYSNSRSSA